MSFIVFVVLVFFLYADSQRAVPMVCPKVKFVLDKAKAGWDYITKSPPAK